MRKCIDCNERFDPDFPTQSVCIDCVNKCDVDDCKDPIMKGGWQKCQKHEELDDPEELIAEYGHLGDSLE